MTILRLPIVSASPPKGISNKTMGLPDIPLPEITAIGIVFGSVIIFAWRYYEHKQDKKALARLLERKADYEQDTNEDSQAP